MTAKEKILALISEEAQKKADTIIAEAENTAAENTAATALEAENECKEIIARTQKKSESVLANAESSAMLLKRDNALKYKSNAINEVLKAVAVKLNSYSDSEYFAFLYSLAEKNALSGKGILFLNQKDLCRNTEEFKEKISALGLTLSDTPREMNGGFILQYGDILINCAIDALIHEKRERLIDVVNKQLFG